MRLVHVLIGASFLAVSTAVTADLTSEDGLLEDEIRGNEVDTARLLESPRYQELLELTRQRENPGPNGRRRGISGSSFRTSPEGHEEVN